MRARPGAVRSGPAGIRAYDERAKAYTEYGISSLGETEYNTGGSVVGNKRIFEWSVDLGGKPTKLGYIEVQESPTFYTYHAEASVEGGPWTVLAEGRARKVE